MNQMTAHFIFKEGKDYSIEFPSAELPKFIKAIRNNEVYHSESNVVSYVNTNELKGYFFFKTPEPKEQTQD